MPAKHFTTFYYKLNKKCIKHLSHFEALGRLLRQFLEFQRFKTGYQRFKLTAKHNLHVFLLQNFNAILPDIDLIKRTMSISYLHQFLITSTITVTHLMHSSHPKKTSPLFSSSKVSKMKISPLFKKKKASQRFKFMKKK
jgi:hypothetical protein